MATIRKRSLPSGLVRWQASYVDNAGKRRAKLFEKKSSANSWLVKVSRDVQLGLHTPDALSPTIYEACKNYIVHCEGRKERGERMTTKNLKLYEGHVINHILQFESGIGPIKTAKLTKSAVGNFRDRLRNHGTSVATTRKILGTLCRVLDLEIANDRLAVNVARGVSVISTRDETTKKVSVPSKAAVRTLLGAADADMRVKVMFAASTGVRAGEQWAARWRHLDLVAKELSVETRVDAYGEEDVTKSAAGMRTIPISDLLIAELRAWKIRSPFSKEHDLIFPNVDGGYIDHTNFLKREWG